jgi:FkbM family methyltransferase
VDVISLDEIITSRIDFIKLDIEGAEFNALKGAENLIKVYRPN